MNEQHLSNIFPLGCLCFCDKSDSLSHSPCIVIKSWEAARERHESNMMIVTNTGAMFSTLWHHAADARGFKGHVSAQASDSCLQSARTQSSVSIWFIGDMRRKKNKSTQFDLCCFSCAIDMNVRTFFCFKRESGRAKHCSTEIYNKCYLNIWTEVSTLKCFRYLKHKCLIIWYQHKSLIQS